MKAQHSLRAMAMTIALSVPMFGQHNHADMMKSDLKKHDMSAMMGKPTVDATVEGVHMKVWLMTQRQQKQMMKKNMDHMMMGKDMKGMKHDGMGMKDSGMAMSKDMKHEDMGMDKATMKAMMAGTHHIMLNATDVAGGKEIPNASANVQIVSPSKKHSSVDLKPMMSHFGCGLTLDEKGKYVVIATVAVNGVSKSKEFQYTVK